MLGLFLPIAKRVSLRKSNRSKVEESDGRPALLNAAFKQLDAIASSGHPAIYLELARLFQRTNR